MITVLRRCATKAYLLSKNEYDDLRPKSITLSGLDFKICETVL